MSSEASELELGSDAAEVVWLTEDPARLVGRGHPIGDFLEAWNWRVLDRADGMVRVEAHLPAQVLNPRGELFGGFTPTYVDFISLWAVKSKASHDREPGRAGLVTLSMRVDYLEPIVGPTFVIESTVDATRGQTDHVRTRLVAGGVVGALAIATLRTMPGAGVGPTGP